MCVCRTCFFVVSLSPCVPSVASFSFIPTPRGVFSRGTYMSTAHDSNSNSVLLQGQWDNGGMLPRSMHVIRPIAVPPAVMNTPTRHDAMAENSGGVYGHFSPSRAHPFVGSAAAATTKKNHFPRAGGKLVTFLSHALPCTGWGGGSMVPKVHIWIYLPHL